MLSDMIVWTRAAAGDVADVATLSMALYEEHPGPVAMDPGKVARTIAALSRAPWMGEVLVGRVDGTAVGFCMLANVYSNELDGLIRIIDELYLVPAHRGHGEGTALLERIVEKARQEGVRALRLEVDRDNPRARALYVRAGFSTMDREHLQRMVNQGGVPPRLVETR